ncbi:MAG: M48 family metalloprotease [candidate division KSB1 bacterium]|nr:M48 family metalloprotease [candidate division KSB1 bacterium]MDZ7346261.1 M48 family metalloprotease [candidate division KSB1 bacterium]
MKSLISVLLIILLAGFINKDRAAAKDRQNGTLPFVSIEEELALGDDLASFSIQHLKIIRNRTIERYLTDLAARIGAVSHWSGLNYTVFVINEKDINHFSLPGGNIYIFRGLLESCSSSEVAAVLAHEIAHLSMRDGVSRLAEKYSYAVAAQQLLGNNPEIAAHIIQSLYTRDTILDYPAEKEFTADRLALEYLEKAELDPAALPVLLRRLIKLEKSDPQRFALLLVTHPPTKKRLKNLQHKKSLHQSVATDELYFQNIRLILERLPY